MTQFAYFCGHEQFHPEELVEHAALAERAGFDLVVVSEHFHPWVDDVGTSGYAFATLGAMAQVTHRVEFITGVTTPLFPPAKSGVDVSKLFAVSNVFTTPGSAPSQSMVVKCKTVTSWGTNGAVIVVKSNSRTIPGAAPF